MTYSMLDSMNGPDIGNYGTVDDWSGGMTQQPQVQRPSFLQAFQGGTQQNPRKKLLAGLAGQAGSGGARGAMGHVAQFLL